MRRAEVVRGLEPLAGFEVNYISRLHTHFAEVSGVPTLWERSFDELLGCFKTPESSIRAFRVLDTDNNGLIDARELLGALAVMSSGHLTERMTLLFDIFDLSGEKDLTFDECFLMIRRTLVGLRKMVGIPTPNEKVVTNMTRQVWRLARKNREDRITHSDWYTWWSTDSSCRNGLKMFVWRPEEQRGLPAPEQCNNVDYAKAVAEHLLADINQGPSSRNSLRPSSRGSPTDPTSSPSGMLTGMNMKRRASFNAAIDRTGAISRAVADDDTTFRKQSVGSLLGVPCM